MSNTPGGLSLFKSDMLRAVAVRGKKTQEIQCQLCGKAQLWKLRPPELAAQCRSKLNCWPIGPAEGRKTVDNGPCTCDVYRYCNCESVLSFHGKCDRRCCLQSDSMHAAAAKYQPAACWVCNIITSVSFLACSKSCGVMVSYE